MKHTRWPIRALALISILALSGPWGPGCSDSKQTGLWVRVTSPRISIDHVVLEVWEDSPDAQQYLTKVELSLGSARKFDAQSELPENQLWVLLIAGSETRQASLLVKGIGSRNGREVNQGEMAGQTFTRNRILDAEGVLELDFDGVDQDEDGFYAGDDCNDNDPEVHPDQTEFCDNIDNNCDETIDEGCGCADESRECWPDWAPEPLGGPCHKGVQTCVGGQWGPCEGVQTPRPEICPDEEPECDECTDEVDNDCDSFVDSKDTDCGGCVVGTWATCYTGPDGTADRGICQYGQAQCLDGNYGPCENEVLPNGWDGTPDSPSEDNLCNARDDDCDGETDNVTIRPSCTNQCGVCAGAQQRCLDGVWIDCEAADFQTHAQETLCLGEADDPLCCQAGTPDCYFSEENTQLCDSLDNDCNCAIDDAVDGDCSCDTGSSMACPQITDPDQGECRAGFYNCTGDQWIIDDVCVEPAPERCDDLDNDCDGVTDRNPQADLHCQENPQANAELVSCNDGTCYWDCQRNGQNQQIYWDLNQDRNQPGGSTGGDGCEYPCALTNPASEICDGQDNDCDSLTDNDDDMHIDVLCPPRANATATTCEAPRDCDYTCNTMYADCFGNDLDLLVPLPGEAPYSGDGCETNLSTNPNHCGGCFVVCDDQEVCISGGCSCGGQGPDCSWPEICCGTVCRNSQTDPTNCGDCGNSCNENAYCDSGNCQCNSNRGNCDNDWSDGCETDLLISAAHCGDCGNNCGQHAHCTGGSCECDTNWGNCDNDWSDGCETDLRVTVAHCGACNDSCGQHSSCSNSTCGCVTNWGNCDNDWSDGCETDLRVTSAHCGGCHNNCGGDAHCSGSSCDCNNNYGNCDNDWSDGCEEYLVNNDNHCGDCYDDCGSMAYCNSTTCACSTNWGNCDDDWSDGCETDLRVTVAHCGACNDSCGQNSTCASSNCDCINNWGNCDSDWSDGCETDLRITANHCGSCNFNCGQNALCTSSNCNCVSISYENCNTDWSDGCEVHLPSDPQNCGGCDNDCGQNSNCTSSSCGCITNYDDCNSNQLDGCEANLLTSNVHCGACNNNCGPNAYCNNGSCACNTNWGNCDDDWSDGCETDLRVTDNHCGTCNFNCGPNASCSGSSCGCDGAWENCFNGWSDGCETNGNTNSNHCGGCNIACGANAHCDNGSCECDTNFGNCDNDWSDGCETDLRITANHCSACNNSCGQNAACASSSCYCLGEYDNCINGWSDGCETDLANDDNNCGSCSNACGQHASCGGSSCSCDTNWDNCDGDWSNGCEADLQNDVDTCGGCSACLSGTNASVACVTGDCTYTCTSGWADCNSSPNNCETALGTDSDCASCNDSCQTGNHEHCLTGACTCDDGWEDCDGNIATNGCEADLSSKEHCGACYDACPGPQSCNAGVCFCNANDADCDRDGTCNCETDNGQCCADVGTSTCGSSGC